MNQVNKKRIKLGSLLAIGSYLLFAVVTTYNAKNLNSHRRELTIDQDCTIHSNKELDPDDVPIFTASFPGSGARMTWQLVSGLTGKPIGDEWDSNGLGKNVITVRTHWPHPSHGRRVEWDHEIQRAFILIRNPIHAIPAFHNTLWVGSAGSDETRKIAPNEAWMRWRDSNFNQQLFLWKQNLQYWFDKYEPENRDILPYEQLVDMSYGANFVEELNKFLGDGETGPGDAKCVWSKVMQEEDDHLREMIPFFDTLDEEVQAMYRTNTFERSFTKEQYNQLIITVRNIRNKYGPEEQRLENTFKMYDAVIKKERDAERYNDLYIH